jgi:hypothetical protein
MSITSIDEVLPVEGKPLRYADMARHFGVSVFTVKRWHRLGWIPRGRRIGRQTYWASETVRGLIPPCKPAPPATE